VKRVYEVIRLGELHGMDGWARLDWVAGRRKVTFLLGGDGWMVWDCCTLLGICSSSSSCYQLLHLSWAVKPLMVPTVR
jgi:hypothetical protein